MSRPPQEVADIVRCAGQSFLERSRKRITGSIKVLLARVWEWTCLCSRPARSAAC